MNDVSSGLRVQAKSDGNLAKASKRFALMALLSAAAVMTVTTPVESFADSRTATTGASAHLNFRVVIPAIIRVTTVTQPDSILIDAKHIENGYIDLDGVTAVKLTNNTRSGYQLTARYDATLLSGLEVRVADQKLTASSGSGSMHVTSGLSTDQMVPIGYRLHLAPGIQAGQYQWPVALAFSLAIA